MALVRKRNIEVSTSDDTSSTDYQEAESSLLAAVVLNIIMLVCEILLLMIGYSLFFDRLNIIQILLHLLGALFLTWFVMDTWGY